MTEQRTILNRLLDKYENSRHLHEPGTSPRRVMLRVEKNDLPEYVYQDADIRDAYNEAAKALEAQQLVRLEWINGRPVLSAVILCVEQVMACYAAAERVHPSVRARQVADAVHNELEGVAVPWIAAWKDDVCKAASEQWKIPAFCRKDAALLQELLCAFREYSMLSDGITMRAFSSRCFSDTKRFERNVCDLFLKIAREYDTELALACSENNLGAKEQLAFLGIYARPELYELAGNCTVFTSRGSICVGAAPYGLALPSTLVDFITAIDLTGIECITFVENKTNYDAYVLAEKQPDELVVYHGGFLSPQKRRLVTLLAHAAPQTVTVRFWADIDLGGFRMFRHLQELIPALVPMRMSGECVDSFREHGLKRSDEYLAALKKEAAEGNYPLFQDAIEKILKYGVTIEQEAFLNE